MPGSETIFAFPSRKLAAAKESFAKYSQAERSNEDCLILDMGEASREQGFRLYGCR